MVILNQKGYREDPSAALRVNLMIYFALAKYYLIKKTANWDSNGGLRLLMV